MNRETIVLGGGCFWCTEAVFKALKGVISVLPGYSGGHTPNPTYESVCGGNTGHAEVVEVVYNPEVIGLDDILTVFFGSHDPTTVNRQGNDVGTEYRSVIFYTTEDQKKVCKEFIDNINNSSSLGKPIVTELLPLDKFFVAEDYNQNFFENNPSNIYCEVVINPKLQKVVEKFAQLIK